ncbi:MAG: T9SS type A sorting domain-containing protein [Bacteroidales bacterium]|nr:T9SS type A sorting domain-containing protein [Bacteroidales bacterium]MCF8458489.1 T9SS type A sorting domain-containing protein [Bacteroidales bacterium]
MKTKKKIKDIVLLFIIMFTTAICYGQLFPAGGYQGGLYGKGGAQVLSNPCIVNYPYFEGFESGPGAWMASGAGSSWALGTPAGTIINSAASGTNSWATNLTGVYNNSENSYVESPCFDFSALTLPVFEFDIWWDIETGWDGATLAYSTNNGSSWTTIGSLQDYMNWYNADSVAAYSNYSPAWSGTQNQGSRAWKNARHTLSTLGGQSSVIFRVVFLSDSFTANEGFAFDNVKIYDAAQYDLALTEINNVPGEYSITPLSQAGPYSLSSGLLNFGYGTLSNVALSVQVNGSSQGSNSIASLAPGAVSALSLASTYTPTVAGSYSFQYSGSTNETDADLSNNTLTETLVVSDSIFARDEGVILGGIGLTGVAGSLGSIFDIQNTDVLTSISVYFGPYNALNVQFSFSIYENYNETSNTVGNLIYTSATYTKTSAMFSNWNTLDIADVSLMPDKYLLVINQLGTANISVGYTYDDDGYLVFFSAPQTSDTLTTTNNWGNLCLRMNFGPSATPLTANLQGTEPVCFGSNTGSIDLTVSGGTPPYFYSWSNGATTQDISYLLAGYYAVTITDVFGASIGGNITLSEPTQVQISLAVVTDASCFGGSDGTTTLNITGGTPPYSYNWGAYGTTQNLSNLSAGPYPFIATDANGCTVNGVLAISQPAAILISGVVTDASCNGASDGSITLTVSGGTMPYAYSWGAYGSSQNILGLSSGTYTVTLTDANGCSENATFSVGEPPIISATSVVTDVSAAGGSDGAIDLTVQGGTPPYYYFWSNGDTTEDISNLAAGTYSVTILDDDSCFLVINISVGQAAGYSLPWTFMNTGINHSILVDSSTPMTIAGVQIAPGDYIGVFYDSLGTLVCGGYQIWQGTSTVVAAWGVDVGNDGFASAEAFKWRIWDVSTNIEYAAHATYLPNPPMPNQGNFVPNGLSGLASLTAGEIQTIPLPVGWFIFSTYIDAFNSSLDSICADILPNLIIVKNGNGQVFWPAFNVNIIGNLTICEGYQTKMSAMDTLEIEGLSVQPQNIACAIPFGWSIVGYLRKAPASITSLLSNIVSQVDIVKDWQGGVYWPVFGVNMIGNMNPGYGYQFKISGAANLTYPANPVAANKTETTNKKPVHYSIPPITDNNMTLGIMHSGTIGKPGDELAVFSKSGLLVGASVVDGDFTSISIWGDDDLTDGKDGLEQGNDFELRLWNYETGEESTLIVDEWLEGDGSYETNKIAVAKIVLGFGSEVSGFRLYQNVPNPFTNETNFSFFSPKDCKIELEIFNLIGKKVATVISEEMAKGKHSITFDSKDLAAGTYYYRLRTSDFEETKKMVVIKQ